MQDRVTCALSRRTTSPGYVVLYMAIVVFAIPCGVMAILYVAIGITLRKSIATQQSMQSERLVIIAQS